MKKMLLLSPIPLNNISSGISIRIKQLKIEFKKLGFQIKTADNYNDANVKDVNYIYIMISTKKDSISSKAAQSAFKGRLIIDLYTPIFLEKETFFSKLKPQDWSNRAKIRKTVAATIRRGDYFLVANNRQKKYWLETASKINAPIVSSKIFVLPTGSGVRKKPPAGNSNKNVILWFGGIYPWLDPLPLVESFANIAKKYPRWKLRMLGGFHPNTGYHDLFQKVLKEAQTTIPKNQLEIIPWQNAEDLPSFLKDVSFAVHIPKQTQEDYYAHRVRLLTVLSYGIPVITTGRDMVSELIAANQAGLKINSSSKEIIKGLTFFINNNRKIKELSQNARKIETIFITSNAGPPELKKVLFHS